VNVIGDIIVREESPTQNYSSEADIFVDSVENLRMHARTTNQRKTLGCGRVNSEDSHTKE